MNIAKLLTDTAARLPERPAVIFGNRQMTYAELDQRTDALAWGLKEQGLKPGQVCVLMMPNSPEWVVCYYALAKLGAAVLPVNFLYRSGELKHIFSDSGAVAFIGHADHLAYAGPVLEEMPQIAIRAAAGEAPEGYMTLDSLMRDQGKYPTHPAEDDDTWAIIYTSGTTGLPKGAMLTHQNLASNAMTISDMRSTDHDAACLGVLPLFHIYGQTSSLNASVYLGLTIRLWEHFDPDETFAAIQEMDKAILIAVPTIYNRLAEMAVQNPPKRSCLQFAISGGASLPVEVLKRFEKAYGATIYEGYGLTECSPVCVENPYGKTTKPGSIGLPIPGFEAMVVDSQDQAVPQGEVGELVVKGPGVMKGYLNQPEATADTLRGGWLHTGDLARRDEDDYIYIVDRKKEMIIRGGYNVYPREIEEVLYQHPAVLEAAVLGVPHEDLGEEIAAMVALRPGVQATPEELRDFVKQLVAPYKYPRIVRLMDELPKTHTGKVLKRAIKI
ncbi:MAG: long-chain fatty acid--CoA ligase [Desulfarculaceae bacterium]|nr:long-chain fatty acid--CoA ligase [Desulfarculaceae bacterium]MCF8071675.1 long-chain fatty acid--CoA ligase [Desulfarculaceae bacterium]MCF8102478.1 long-chain fatty acid--CoA ligase [Desulfarculaceae bacterium]MCF8116820.1 long-chain fatty acid--CoA ligase [Desulfarculaceae bacterium]